MDCTDPDRVDDRRNTMLAGQAVLNLLVQLTHSCCSTTDKVVVDCSSRKECSS